MKLVPNTARQWPEHFPLGSKFFMLDIGSRTPPGAVAAESEKNYQKYGKMWAPANFVSCTVTELAEGAFGFTAVRKLCQGNTSGCVGESFPLIINEGEMHWLQQTLRRLQTIDPFEIQKRARAGDEDAMTITWYCQLAQYYCYFHGQSEKEFPFFKVEQFLQAARECVL